VADPEAKRKIIGREFVEVFQARGCQAQGAAAAARATSGAGHHLPGCDRVGRRARPRRPPPSRATTTSAACPSTLGLKLLEPLRELFKDEVRELGVALGLPREMVYRHPFPGPGLGVRILGEVQTRARRPAAPRRRHLHRGAAQLPSTTPTGKSWYDLTSQAFAVFLPVKSVGVMGDGRTYDHVVALRAVQTSDFMTADWARPALRAAEAGVQPHHQRGARHQPGGVRRDRASRRRRSSGNEGHTRQTGRRSSRAASDGHGFSMVVFIRSAPGCRRLHPTATHARARI
jgi:GMP synthase (glutamine-hydrolysing) B subunit